MAKTENGGIRNPWIGASGVGLGALLLYALTLTPCAAPGESAALLVRYSGLDPLPPLVHPLWELALKLVVALSGSLVGAAHGLSAASGAVAVAMVFLLAWRIASVMDASSSGDLRRHLSSRSVWIRWSGALCAALLLGLNPPFWIASTRAHFAAFDAALMLLAAHTVMRTFGATRIQPYLLASIMLGIVTAENPAYFPMAVLGALAMVWSMTASSVLIWPEHWGDKQSRLHPLFSALACGIGGLLLVTGFSIVRIWLSPAAEWLGIRTCWNAAGMILRAMQEPLLREFPVNGWALSLLVTVGPAALLAFVLWGMDPGRRFRAVPFLFALALLGGAVAWSVPLTPWRLFGLEGLPVLASLWAAVWTGITASALARLGLRTLDGWDVPSFRANPAAMSVIRHGIGIAAPAILVIAIAASATVSVRESDGRPLRPLGEFILRVARDVGNRDALVENSPFGDPLRIALHDTGSRTSVLTVHDYHSAVRQSWLAAQWKDPYLIALLKNAPEVALAEWISRQPHRSGEVATLDFPEIMVWIGDYPRVQGSVYQCLPESAKENASKLWTVEPDFIQALDGIPAPYQPWGMWARAHLARVANDRGVEIETSGRIPDALASYRTALQWVPNYPAALANGKALARASGARPEQLKEWSPSAPDAATRIHSLEPGATGAAAQKEAEDLKLALLPDARSETAPVLLNALSALQKGDASTAERLAKEAAAARGDDDLNVLFIRLSLALKDGRTNDALRISKTLEAIAPQNPVALTARALWAEHQGDVRTLQDIAAQFLDRRLEPPPEVILALARAEIRAGRWSAARDRLAPLSRKYPALLEAWMLQARADVAMRDRAAAEYHLSGILRLDRTNPMALQILASLRIEDKHWAEAEALLRTALSRGRTPYILNDLAWTLLQQNRAAEAEALAREAAAAAPKNSAIADTLAQIETALGRTAQSAKPQENPSSGRDLF